MSPSVGNFVHDLVEMAKAMEELPAVQAQLHEMEVKHNSVLRHVEGLESNIQTYKAEIERLNEAVRSAEVARDDAELRFLEADDHIAAFRRLVSGFSTDTVNLLRAIDPPQPEPVVETKPEPVYPSWSEHTTAFGADPNAIRVEVHPTAEPSPIQTDAPSTPAPAEVVGSIGGAGEGVSPGQSACPPIHSQFETTAPVDTTTSTASHTEPVVSMGESADHPTSAPAPATGTGTEPAAYGSDEEPTKHEWVNGIKQIRQAWFDWYDRQPYEFKQHYNWDAA